MSNFKKQKQQIEKQRKQLAQQYRQKMAQQKKQFRQAQKPSFRLGAVEIFLIAFFVLAIIMAVFLFFFL